MLSFNLHPHLSLAYISLSLYIKGGAEPRLLGSFMDALAHLSNVQLRLVHIQLLLLDLLGLLYPQYYPKIMTTQEMKSFQDL